MKPKPAEPALTGPPPPAVDPSEVPWQGNAWKPCPASELEYIGVGPKVTKPVSVDFGSVPVAEQNAVIILGIEPRPPKPGEYENNNIGGLAGLAETCSWVTEDFAHGSYNCFGYVIAREAVAKGENIRVWEPGNEMPPNDNSIKTYDAFFGLYGYVRIPEPAGAEIPQPARIALFSEQHVALRSDYRYKSEDLWESKLGTSRLRIIHPLRALEGSAYGHVAHWYRKA